MGLLLIEGVYRLPVTLTARQLLVLSEAPLTAASILSSKYLVDSNS